MIRLIICLILLPLSATADDYVNGYYQSNGNYVQPYQRTRADNNPYNNYSTQGNMNPYTGAMGTIQPPNPWNPSMANRQGFTGGTPTHGYGNIQGY